jgi:sugar O-acyltransferase (sialic acid O-acetyltransferase NeuD family)
LGAGGHAQVIADILLRAYEQNGAIQPIGYVDDNLALLGQTRLGLPIWGPISQLGAIDHDAVIIGIGHNNTRYYLYEKLQRQGVSFATACHPHAVIARDVMLGPGSVICAGVVVNPGSVIGQNVILNTGCTVDHHNSIGDHAHVAPGVHLGGDVTIGPGALIGIGATVMSQRKVGAWAIVGASALVHADVPKQATVIGVPARIVRRFPVKKNYAKSKVAHVNDPSSTPHF